MKNNSELFRQVSYGIIFAQCFCVDNPFSGSDLLFKELRSTDERLSGVGEELGPQHSDEISNVVAILYNIAEIAEDRQFNVLAADSKRLAADITRCLKSEQLEGETDVSH